MTSESCEVKFRKSVRYAIRSSSDVLSSRSSTSCVKMTGHLGVSDGSSEDGAVDGEWCECSEYCVGVAVRIEDAALVAGDLRVVDEFEYGQIRSIAGTEVSISIVACNYGKVDIRVRPEEGSGVKGWILASLGSSWVL
jgi:hypothetical protein